MTNFTIAQVQDIAVRYDYEEMSCNEISRVISFRGGPRKSTRINVYYTTGTVGTCLNHPKQGKTQLFRRDVDAESLDEIFKNPRTHTGDGYHRKQISQQWLKNNSSSSSSSGRTKSQDRENNFEWDSAQRWRFVAPATGLTNSDREIEVIAEICSAWDALYWEPGDTPSTHYVKYACGSHGGLVTMLFEVVKEVGGVTSCCHKKLKKFRAGDILAEDLDTERPFEHECDNLKAFMAQHRQDVLNLKKKCKGLRKNLKIELAQWLLGRTVCGWVIIDKNNNELTTNFSDSVYSAHGEYGELVYPKKAAMCPFHGVVDNEKIPIPVARQGQ
jgi:hypothetical protein